MMTMAAATQDLELFVREALSRGQSREAIEAALDSAGWPKEQARSALNAYALVDFPVPVPKPRPYLSAREAFLYLVLFATLYFTAYNFGSLLFDLINWWRPDPARAPYEVVQLGPSMRWAEFRFAGWWCRISITATDSKRLINSGICSTGVSPASMAFTTSRQGPLIWTASRM